MNGVNEKKSRLDVHFYPNRAETKCIVHETYTNSEAVFAHTNGVALSYTILPKVFIVSRISRFDVFHLLLDI